MKIALLVGTRPEIIKMAPIIRACIERKISFILIHSNQHYSDSMDSIFFNELNLPSPDYNLNVGSGGHANQIGNIIIKIEPILIKEKADVLLVQGDTNTVAAGALTASKLGIKIGHIEAGLRSYDRTMPEEGNRIITDHLSDYLFAVSKVQSKILTNEGIDKNKIFTVGNTIVDSVFQNKDISKNSSTILSKLEVTPKSYTLFTAHRASNVDKEKELNETIDILKEIEGTIIWPMHPRTRKNIDKFKISIPNNTLVTSPLGFFDFLNLEQCAKLIVTDSGGLQEEACILGIPCITIGSNTERPETVQVGANRLVGRSVEKFKEAYRQINTQWTNPFGDGTSAKKILDIIAKDFEIVKPSSTKKLESIAVIGMGYMGIPTAGLLATSGYSVTGVDICKAKVENLNKGIIPFEEPGVDTLIQNAIKNNAFSTQTKTPTADIYIVAVPTPHNNKTCDLRHVISACTSISETCKDNALIIIESTIKPNTCRDIISPIFKKACKNVDIAHCPERAIPGNTLHELVNNDRIIGGLNEGATDKAFSIYSSFCKGRIFKTKAVNAECAKLMENTYRDVNIALANEFLIISDDIGFDVNEAINLANRHPRVNILQPGPGVGGHCIPIDPWFLTEDTNKSKLINTARNINDSMPRHWVSKLNIIPNVSKVGILGAAYKSDVDDARESPALQTIKILTEQGYEVKVTDPFVKDFKHKIDTIEEVTEWADVIIILTNHSEYKSFKSKKPTLDTRHFGN